jgi:hypothetical protein
MTRAGPMEKREIWIQAGVILAEHSEDAKAPSRLAIAVISLADPLAPATGSIG